MNVKVIKNQTLFLIPKYQGSKIRECFANVVELENMPIKWNPEGYYYLNRILHEVLINKVKYQWIKLFSNPKIIKGYSGCPITFTEFQWKV